MGDLLLVRHGETEWSRSGQHTSFTDLPLTEHGEEQAASLAPLLAGRSFALVLTSPLGRAVRTAELAGLPGAVRDADLHEWHYGAYEGVTTEEIHRTRPDWDLWTDGGRRVPRGGRRTRRPGAGPGGEVTARGRCDAGGTRPLPPRPDGPPTGAAPGTGAVVPAGDRHGQPAVDRARSARDRGVELQSVTSPGRR